MTVPSTPAVSFRLDGRTALVIGGVTGIGRAIATALVEQGAEVVIGSRSQASGAAVAAEIGAEFVALDVTVPGSVDAAVDQLTQQGRRLDIAVNSPGGRLNKPAEHTTDEEWDDVFAVNADGIFRACRAEGRVMLAQGGGVIVNVASMSALAVNTPQTQSAYNASKAAVVMYTKSIAAEWAPRKVRVNSISPGYTATAMTEKSRSEPAKLQAWLDRTPQARVAEPHEIAGSAVFLASDAATFVTGHNLVVDGGYTLW